MRKILVIGEHLIHLVTPEIIDQFRSKTGEDTDLLVAESVNIPTIKEEPHHKPNHTFDRVTRAEQRRRNKMTNRMTRRKRYI